MRGSLPVSLLRAAPPATGAGASTLLLCLALACASRAEAAGWALLWERQPEAASCPEAEEVKTAVERRLGTRVFVEPEEARYTLAATLARGAEGMGAELTVRDARGAVVGERRHQTRSGSCAELGEALVLIVSLLVDPHAEPPAPSLSAPPLAAGTPWPTPAPPPTPSAPRPPPAPERSRGDLLLLPAAAVWVLPSPSFGARLGLGWQFAGGLVLDLTAEAWLPGASSASGTRWRYQAGATALTACPPALAVQHLRVCLETELLGVLARSEDAARGWLPGWALGLGPLARWRFLEGKRLGIGAFASVVIRPLRAQPSGAPWEIPLVGAQTGLGGTFVLWQ